MVFIVSFMYLCACACVCVSMCMCIHTFVRIKVHMCDVLQMYSIRSLPTMGYREQREEDGVEDMTQLE